MKKFNFLLIAFCFFAFSSCEDLLLDQNNDSGRPGTTLPDGTVVFPNGDIRLGNNAGRTIDLPGGGTITVPGGTIIYNDGNIRLPNNSGAVIRHPDGRIEEVPEGSVIDPDGNVIRPTGGTGGAGVLILRGQRYEMYFFTPPVHLLDQTLSLTSNTRNFTAADEYGNPTKGTVHATLFGVPVRSLLGGISFHRAKIVIAYCVIIEHNFMFDDYQSANFNQEICHHCGQLIGYNAHISHNTDSFESEGWPLVMQEDTLEPHKILRYFSYAPNVFILSRTSNFSSNITRTTSKTFTFPLLRPEDLANVDLSVFPGDLSTAILELSFSHTITADFELTSRNFYKYRSLSVSTSANTEFYNIRSSQIVRNYSLSEYLSPTIYVIFIEYNTPFFGEVLAFSLAPAPDYQFTPVARRIIIN